jgi:hypothetical protein
MHMRVGELQEIHQMNHEITRQWINERLESALAPIQRVWARAIADLIEDLDGEKREEYQREVAMRQAEAITRITQQRDELLSAALFLSLRLRAKLENDDMAATPGDRVALLEFDQVRQRIEEDRRRDGQ